MLLEIPTLITDSMLSFFFFDMVNQSSTWTHAIFITIFNTPLSSKKWQILFYKFVTPLLSAKSKFEKLWVPFK